MIGPPPPEGHMTEPFPDAAASDDQYETDDTGFADVVAEIEAETERRRMSGDYPAELLERLDSEFDRFAPLSFRRTGIDGAIRAVESAAFVNVDAPVESTRRSARTVKTAVKKSTAWYHLHLARQVTALGIQMTRPLRMLNEHLQGLDARVSELEARLGQESPAVSALTASLGQHLPTDELAAHVAGLVSGRPGRVAHLGAADPLLVRRLVDDGVDAYGVDPHGGGGLDLEIRAEQPLAHLRSLGPGVLGGVILSGVTDTAPTHARVELCRLAVDRVAPGGRVVVITTDRDTWIDEAGAVVADLAAASPLHTETWMYLLERFGARAPRLEATVGPHHVIVGSAS